MPKGAITEYMDVAQVVLYAFWVFFAGLIFYLRREDKREGYPLVADRVENLPYTNFPPIPEPKVFRLADGETVLVPRPDEVEPRDIKAVPIGGWPGAPLEPIGDPMLDAVGPGSYALRADVPDLTFEGLIKIVPLRVASGQVVVQTEAQMATGSGKVTEVDVASVLRLSRRDPDPRGMPMLGADGLVAGTITDVWADRSELLIRYLEVEIAGPTPFRVLAPMPFCKVDKNRGLVQVQAILAAQFANVPRTKDPDIVTLLEEDRICAYFGAGTLYATPQRAEPLL
jgi:photosynthetic reaction center H subunit